MSEPGQLEYRQHLVLARQKAQEDYDKSVLALSGGALGISMAFVEKVVGPGAIHRSGLLVASWMCWAASVACVLVSYFLSRHALLGAIEAVDSGQSELRRPGGRMSVATEVANVLSGLLFLIGVVTIAFFVVVNLGG